MSTSFIVNPEIKLVVSKKSLSALNKNNDVKEIKVTTQPQVKFSDHELDLVKKLNELKLESKSTNEKKKEKSLKRDKTTTLSLAELKQLKANLADGTYLCDILDEAELILPENEIVERNPILEKRIQRLKAEQEQRVYNTMTKNVDTRRKFEPEETISYQLKQINRQLIAVAQFIFTVISGFFFGFLGIELIVGNLDFGFRLLLGIICALIIALAEIYFLAKKLNEEDVIIETPVKTSEKLKTN